MTLTAKEAATAVGMTKAGIIRAIHVGKISAEKDGNGQWQIQPVELFRVYTPVNGNGLDAQSELDASQQPDIARWQAENEALRRRLADKDELIRAKDLLIELLTGENTRLTAVVDSLTPPQSPKGFWRRLLGG